jgi:hypothetical protein
MEPWRPAFDLRSFYWCWRALGAARDANGRLTPVQTITNVPAPACIALAPNPR